VTDTSSFAVTAEGVGKRYRKLEQRPFLLQSILPFLRPKAQELWAVRDVNFSVAQGETVGVIGRNGAGKSTMLRMLAGVSRPTTGRISTRGRVAPLLSVGVGFHPEMSGRENVFVNGMLLGFSEAELKRRFDDIVAFSELEDFIDTPVKFYSSGMFMRLGFSVAIHVDPQILLVDEILAVGDVAFQLKCYERIRQLQGQGTAVLVVTHNMHAVRLLCPRAIVMTEGRLVHDGDVTEAIALHHQLMDAKNTGRRAFGSLQLMSQSVSRPDGSMGNSLTYDEPAIYRVRVRFNEEVADPCLFFHVTTEAGVPVSATQAEVDKTWRTFQPGEEATVEIPFRARLGGGSYRLSIAILDRKGYQRLHRVEGSLVYVAPRLGTNGISDLLATLYVDGEDRTWDTSLMLAGDADPSSPKDSAQVSAQDAFES
jgi:lipopolysaccharide transport system ATP-binding protein